MRQGSALVVVDHAETPRDRIGAPFTRLELSFVLHLFTTLRAPLPTPRRALSFNLAHLPLHIAQPSVALRIRRLLQFELRLKQLVCGRRARRRTDSTSRRHVVPKSQMCFDCFFEFLTS